MLTSLKGKLLNVSKLGLLSPPADEAPEAGPPINVNAGTKILTHFQHEWAELHEINEENAKNAAALAETITTMHTKISHDYSNVAKIIQILNTTPTLNKSVDKCLMQIKNLQRSFEVTERSLENLEGLIEKLELENKKADHKYQLVLYQEKKLSNFDKLRTELAEKHTLSLKEQELKQKKVLEERQQAFEDAFNNDLETFKSLGSIPKIETKMQPSALLEEIQLDLDEQDLESFLNAK